LHGQLGSGQQYILTSSGNQSDQAFAATLAASGGHLRLTDDSTELDLVGWGTAAYARGQTAPAPAAGDTLQRQQVNGLYRNTGDNYTDFTSNQTMAAAASSTTTANIKLSELLPDPDSPAADATDEYIELYNAGSETAVLTNYKLVTGTALNKSFRLDNDLLAPGEYKAFYSSRTKLSLSNNGSTVRLQAPDGSVLSEVAYPAAQAGSSWAWSGTDWQWSTMPTPNAVNILSGLAAKTSAKPTATAKKKTTTTKTTKKATKSTAASSDVKSGEVSANSPAKMHSGVVAGVGGLAVLYGAYEYRQDMANLYRKLRRNRTLRRKDRTAT
jgi:hypothetical protein